MKTLKEIGIKSAYETHIIAEIGINHGGNIELAKKLIDSAHRAGVDSVKFQTYLTEKRTKPGSPIFDILKNCELSFDAFKELKDYSDKKGIIFFSTPFDDESIEYLETINCPFYKIASFDLVNKPFLEKIAKTTKPVILSVGMSNINEIETAVKILSKNTNKVALLHCISAYPTKEEDANLAAIHTLREKFGNHLIGHSDHTDGIKIPLYAVAAGAKIIEKHFKISADMDCVDAPVSITEEQMKQLVKETRALEKIMGDGIPELTEVQKEIEQYRRYSN